MFLFIFFIFIINIHSILSDVSYYEIQSEYILIASLYRFNKNMHVS